MMTFPQFHIDRIVFPNGMRLLVIPVKDVKTLSLFVIFHTGSNYEDRAKAGISHFMEHMMFKGTPKRPSTKIITEELDSMGASYNAFTGKELTAYYIKAASYRVDEMFDILADITLHAQFKNTEIKKERGVITEEFNMYNDMPMERAGMLFEEAAFGDQPEGRPIIGFPKTIGTFTRKDFLRHRTRHYTSKNMLVVAAGDITAEKARRSVHVLFSKVAGGEESQKPPFCIMDERPRLRIKQKKTDQVHVVVGFRAYDRFSEKKYAAAVLASILGGNMSSRFFLDIRDKRGLAYYIGTTTDTMAETGMFYTKAGIRNGKAEEALEIILKAHRAVAKTGVTEKELKKNQDYIVSKLILGLETSDDLANFFGSQEILKEEIVQAKEFAKKIYRVSLADIKNVALEMFTADRLACAAVGAPDEKKIKDMLEHF